MRIGILTNDIPASFGTPCAGVSVRVQGLFQGLRAHGIDCQILVPRSLMSDRRQRWKDFFPRFSDEGNVRIFRAPNWLEVRAEYDRIVLSNWGSTNYIDVRHLVPSNLIYDFFSPSMVEFTSGDGMESQLRRAQEVKRELVSAALLRLANGPLIANYANEWITQAGLTGCDAVFPVTCGLNWTGDGAKQPVFLVGGYAQTWTREISEGWLERLALRFPEAVFVRVGHGRHYHFGRMQSSDAEVGAPNIVDYATLAYEDYQRINELAAGLIDISQDSAERGLSVSTRAVASLSAGCPVIHNRNTWLGRAMDEAGMGTALDVGAEDAEEQLVGIVGMLIEKRGKIDVQAFWARHLDPQRNTKDLVGAL